MQKQLKSGAFFGQRIRTHTASGLVLADVLYPARTHIPKHSHERAYFCLIRKGGYTERYDRRTRVCGPKTLVFHPVGERHSQTLAEHPVASFNVEISREWIEQAQEFTGVLDQPAEFHGGEIPALASHLFREFAARRRDASLSIESLTFEILTAFAKAGLPQPGGKEPRWLIMARDYLETGFRDPLTLRELALQVGVHPVHLAATFRRFYGCSVGEYLRRRRIAYVRERLSDSTIALAEIALEGGFTDQSHLTRVFKRFTEKTPGQYRTFLRYKSDPPHNS